MTRPKRPKRRPVTGGLRVRACEVLRRAVEEGLDYGWMRAHKHTDRPDEATIKDQILQGIMNEVCENFDFDDKVESAES
jgi:hypothetical protein